MEDVVSYQKVEDRKVRIAISLIYKRLIKPTCDIVDLSWDLWHKFRFANEKERKKMALRFVNRPHFQECLDQVTWIPLDSPEILKVVSEDGIIIVTE